MLREYFTRVGTMILSLVLVLVVLAAIRTYLEYIFPSYSGFGPWRPFVELVALIIILSGVLLLIELFATTLTRLNSVSRFGLFGVGATCALGASQPLLGPIMNKTIGAAPSEWLVMTIAVVSAIILRCYFGRRGIHA